MVGLSTPTLRIPTNHIVMIMAATVPSQVGRWMEAKQAGNNELQSISEAHMAMMAEIRNQAAA